jgi:ribosomal protein S26
MIYKFQKINKKSFLDIAEQKSIECAECSSFIPTRNKGVKIFKHTAKSRNPSPNISHLEYNHGAIFLFYHHHHIPNNTKRDF